jgi:hypothetical protein
MGGDQVHVSKAVANEIEAFVNERYLPTIRTMYRAEYTPNLSTARANIPSPIIRLDMPPAYDTFNGVYEVECNTAGLGIASLLGIPVAERSARAIRALDISEIGWFTAPSRDAQHEDHQIFMGALEQEGIKTIHLTEESAAKCDSLPLWLRAGDEDIVANGLQPLLSRCLLLHNDGGGHKGYLAVIDDAKILNTLQTCLVPFNLYPEGFCLKPKRSWGTRRTYFWLPKKSGGSNTKTKMEKLLESAYDSQEEWVVQRLHFPRKCEEGYWWIWRLYLAWDGESYRVVGGLESGRPSLRVHGASDTVTVPILYEH